RHALTATREDLFKKVDHFIEQDADIKHLLVLADSGTGKTTFVLNFYAHNARKPRQKAHRLAIVPLGLEDADKSIAKIPDPEKTVIFLDAFDEDTKAVADHRGRIMDLMGACKKFKRVIITCRTQFFRKDEEIPLDTGILRIGPRKAGVKGGYEFRKLYLSPFDDKDIKRYLIKRYPFWRYPTRRKALALALKIPFLSARPMLLAHIPDVVEAGGEISYVFQLYDIMIEAWLERESAWV
ncbi:MAG: hypothetical protein GY859_20340, partial [Desulfobacterales bacterium]|nr:hypothetical protein [Desulfobacterales bacterium]